MSPGWMSGFAGEPSPYIAKYVFQFPEVRFDQGVGGSAMLEAGSRMIRYVTAGSLPG